VQVKFKRYIQDYAGLLLITGLIIILDQWTKSLVRANLDFLEVWSPWPWLEPYARIVHWKNTGAAFGILENFGEVFKWLAAVVSIGIIYFFPQVPRQDWLLRSALILQLSGALGNFIDRITQGWVTDFISVGEFAVFNVADASISVGTVLLVIGMWLKERQEKAVAVTAAAQDVSGETPAQTPHA
jgi:signal peptidase II